MKGSFLLLAFISVFGFCKAQTIPTQVLSDTGTFRCPFDTSVTIKGITNVTAYQTINDEWDGPIDSTWCINVYNTYYSSTYPPYGYKLYTNDIDVGHPVFLSLRLDTNQVLLNPNFVYSLNTYLYGNQPSGNGCPNNFCFGAVVGVRIPDSTGTGYDHRYSIIGDSLNVDYFSACLVTEKFDSNVVDQITYKFTPRNTAQNDSILFNPVYLNSYYYQNIPPVLIDSILLTQTINPNHYTIDYGSYYPTDTVNYLLQYKDSTYPNANHISLVEASPSPNTNTIDTLDINVRGQFTNFLFQPFVNLVGAHPVGDTINRHIIHYINNGGNTCLGIFIDKGFEHFDKFVYKSGILMFEHPMSCFFFGKGGALEVADGATMHYGMDGKGMMILKTGGTIIIGKGAELVIGNTVTMEEYYGEQPAQIYMTLNQGSKLTFAPGARLENNYSINGAMKLNIFMKGGVLDDSGLPAEDKANINLIYDQPNANPDDNLKIMGNPIQGTIQFSYLTDQAENITVELVDLQGRIVNSEILGCQKGINYLQTGLNNGMQGVYLLRIVSANNTIVKKLVKP